MKRELKERLGRLGPIRDIGRVPSGSPADVVIRPAGTLAKVRTVDATHALVRRDVPVRSAMAAIDAMVETGEAVLEVPLLEASFADEMRKAGIEARRIAGPVDAATLREIREKLGMSVAAFARRFHLNARTVEGWEQGRPIDPIAGTYLRAIAAEPDTVARSLEEAID